MIKNTKQKEKNMSTNAFREIKFPKLVTARDYHEFDVMHETLVAFGVRGVRFAEVGTPELDGKYRAVFYVGAITKPSTAALINRINKRAGYR
jgi:hypothetical protein